MPYGTVLDDSYVIYVYDSSYQGLFSAVFDAVYDRCEPAGIVTGDRLQLALGARYKEAATDAEKARRVLAAARQKLGGEAMRRIYLAFLSSDDGREMAIYRYLMLGFKLGRAASSRLTDADVFRVSTLAQNVSRETDKMQGFMRFSVMESGTQYCRFSPKNNILPLVLGHFASRLRPIPFVIHDTGRALLGVWDTHDKYIVGAEGFIPPEKSADEKAFEEAWRLFYDTIGIGERKNPRLMKQLMPARYFRHYWDIAP